MIKTHVTIGKETEGFITINTGDDYHEFYNLVGTLRETVIRFCENNAASTYHKQQQVSYYMPVDRIDYVLKTMKAENS